MSTGVLAVFGLMMATLGATVGFVLRGIFLHGGSDAPRKSMDDYYHDAVQSARNRPMDDAVVNVPETLRLRGLL